MRDLAYFIIAVVISITAAIVWKKTRTIIEYGLLIRVKVFNWALFIMLLSIFIMMYLFLTQYSIL